MGYPFPRAPVKKKREGERRTGDRVRLRGKAKTQRRREIFERSGGKCEAIHEYRCYGATDIPTLIRCNAPITWQTMEWSHPRHGPYKDDREGIASCKDCHRNAHNAGGKPCARKAGRKMNQKEALAYWNGIVCFCGGPKGKRWSFCFDCLQKLSPQLRDDLEKVIGKDYLETMALAEQALLAWKPAEEKVG